MTGIVPVMVGAIEGLDADQVTPDPDVVEQVNLLKVARGRKDANEAARRGDHAGAARLIDELLPMAAAMPAMAEELDELRTDAVRLASGDRHEAGMKRNYSTARTMERDRGPATVVTRVGGRAVWGLLASRHGGAGTGDLRAARHGWPASTAR